MTDGKLGELASINENSRIKSGSWDAVGAFVYTTSTHIKYLLPNGESGIIRTLDFPYLRHICHYRRCRHHHSTRPHPPHLATAASAAPSAVQSIVTYVDREGKTGRLQVEATEYMFKLALMRRRNRDVLRIMQSKKLVGESIIAYLHKKGYPEVALHFVEDLHIKFSLRTRVWQHRRRIGLLSATRQRLILAQAGRGGAAAGQPPGSGGRLPED